MAALHCTLRPRLQRDTPAIRRRAPGRGAPRDDSPGRGAVLVAHLVSLLSVGALVIGLTFGSIALARRCKGAAATATDDGGGFHAGTATAVSPR